MALGYADAQAQRHEVCGFFDWTDPQAVCLLGDRPQPARIDRRRDPLRLR
jgi:NTE family protein